MKQLFICVFMSLLTTGAHAAALQQSIAFVSNRDGNAHIYITRGENTDKALTKGSWNNTQPAWSPDGEWLAFSSVRDGLSSVYIMRADGTKLQRLNSSQLWQTSPSWSPDGKAVAYFARDNAQPGVELHIASLQGKQDVTKLAIDGRDKGPDSPVWSADATSLAYLAMNDDGKADVWVINRDGTDSRNVSEAVSKRNKAHPAFSPDGRYLLYIADMRGHLAVIRTDLTTGMSVNLTEGKPAAYETPRWSPDGRKIVFASSREDPGLTRMDVFTMNADGSNVVNLSQHPHEDFNPHWTADSKAVVFTSLRSGTAQIFAYDLQKKSATRITENLAHDMDQVPQPIGSTAFKTAVTASEGE
jgi:TolB protein